MELYTPAAKPDGFESVKEIFYEQDAIDLGAYFGLNLGGKNVVASLVTDLTDNASPGRLTFATYDLLANMVQRDELVFWATPPSESRFNTTLLEYNDPNNPHLVTRQIMPNGFTLTMTHNPQGNLSTVNESYSDTTMVYRYTEYVDTPPFNPKWRNQLRETAIWTEWEELAEDPRKVSAGHRVNGGRHEIRWLFLPGMAVGPMCCC